jgi:hypothetical protein
MLELVCQANEPSAQVKVCAELRQLPGRRAVQLHLHGKNDELVLPSGQDDTGRNRPQALNREDDSCLWDVSVP